MLAAFAAREGPFPLHQLRPLPKHYQDEHLWMLRRRNTVRAEDTGDLLPFPLAVEGRISTGSRVDVRGTSFAYRSSVWARPTGQVRSNEVILLCLNSGWDG